MTNYVDFKFRKILGHVLNNYASGVILDSGCYENEFKFWMKKHCEWFHVVGIDIIKRQNVDIVYDGVKTLFEDCHLNIITSNYILEHIEDKFVYLKELHRILDQDGVLVLSVPTKMWHVANLISIHSHILAIKRLFKKQKNIYVHGLPEIDTFFDELRRWNINTYEWVFDQVGFKIKEKEYHTNFLSLDKYYFKIFGKIKMPNFLNVHITYELKKK